jgi:2-methylisocitrate lyase-like PEP mutase family enzyme
VSATLLGEPDLGLLTPPEMSRKAGQIVYSLSGVPVLVDADSGAWLGGVGWGGVGLLWLP